MAYETLGEVDWQKLLSQGITAYSDVSKAKIGYKTAKIQAQTPQFGPADYSYPVTVPAGPRPPFKLNMTTVMVVGALGIGLFLMTQKKRR